MNLEHLLRGGLFMLASCLALGCHRVPDQDSYRRDAEKELGELNRRLEELGAKSARATAKTQAKAERALSDLRAETDGLARRIDDLDSVASEKLDRAKAELEQRLDALKRKLDRARSGF